MVFFREYLESSLSCVIYKGRSDVYVIKTNCFNTHIELDVSGFVLHQNPFGPFKKNEHISFLKSLQNYYLDS